MTSTTYAANSIMAYVGADADVVGVSGTAVLPYWEGDDVYFFQTSGTPGIRKFDIDPDGDETLQRSKTAIGTDLIDVNSGGAAAVSYDGSQLFFIAKTGNTAQIAEVATADLTLTATFGTASSSTLASTSSRVLMPNMMVSHHQNGGYRLLMGSSPGFSIQDVNSLPQSGFTPNANLDTLNQTASNGVRLSGSAPAGGPAYAMGCPFRNGVASAGSSLPVELYLISQIGGSISSIGTFDFADIDATWTKILNLVGMAFDETDGNVIIGVETNDSGPTNKKYIAKISTSDASVLWVRPVNNMTAYSWGFTHSRIRNEVFHYIGASNTIYHIDTSDGSVTTETTFASTILPSGPQVSDDVTNSVIVYGSFTPSGTPPTYLGSYMDTGGHHTLTGKWMRLWFATEDADVPDPGDGTPGENMGGLAQSDLRAWTFTLDKHKFYVLDLGAEGTWVYDILTGEWSRFYTDGYSSRWDATNGVMWQKRIVAGDLVTANVWEVSAAAVQDNDALDIAHVVTGGLQYRGRDMVSCDRVSVATTVGKLGNSAGSTLRLRFSDDGGNTWSDYFDVALTQADHTVWADFISLGSFAAPGRVFEISDSSGPVRIDGCEAIIGGDKGGASG